MLNGRSWLKASQMGAASVAAILVVVGLALTLAIQRLGGGDRSDRWKVCG
jgi:hypothetical protein